MLFEMGQDIESFQAKVFELFILYTRNWNDKFKEFGSVGTMIAMSSKIDQLRKITKGGIRIPTDSHVQSLLQNIAILAIVTLMEIEQHEEKELMHIPEIDQKMILRLINDQYASGDDIVIFGSDDEEEEDDDEFESGDRAVL